MGKEVKKVIAEVKAAVEGKPSSQEETKVEAKPAQEKVVQEKKPK